MKRLSISPFIAVLTIVSMTGLSSQFSQASDFQSPRTSALGGAGHAAPLLSDAIYLNPSYTSFITTHALSFNYMTFSTGNIMNIAVLDGTADSLFQAGVAYTRRPDGSILHVGASKELMKKYGIGLGGKFIFPNDFGTQRYIDATFSATGLFSKWLQVALVVDNLAQAAVNRGFYREVVLGTKINVDSILLIYLDPHWTPGLSSSNAWGYEAGIEFPFFTDLFLRLGQFTNSMVPYQAAYGTGFGVGGGWLAPKLSIDYSFTRTNAPVPSYAHNFGATIYF